MNDLPTINIPPRIRFALYLGAAVALLTISYAADKHWAGAAEVRYVTGLAALVQLLAAAKVNLAEGGDLAATLTQLREQLLGRRMPPTPPPADPEPEVAARPAAKKAVARRPAAQPGED